MNKNSLLQLNDRNRTLLIQCYITAMNVGPIHQAWRGNATTAPRTARAFECRESYETSKTAELTLKVILGGRFANWIVTAHALVLESDDILTGNKLNPYKNWLPNTGVQKMADEDTCNPQCRPLSVCTTTYTLHTSLSISDQRAKLLAYMHTIACLLTMILQPLLLLFII